MVGETGETLSNGGGYALDFLVPLTAYPLLDIYLFSLAVALFITLVNKHFTDQEKIRALRAEMKELQKNMREVAAKKPEKARQIQQDIFQKNLEILKSNLRPKIMLINMIPALFILLHIANGYAHYGDLLYLGLFEFAWLGSYITFSIVNSLILKKLLNVA